jgi:hypothetical protein
LLINLFILTCTISPSTKSDDCIQGILPLQYSGLAVLGVPPPVFILAISSSLRCSQVLLNERLFYE